MALPATNIGPLDRLVRIAVGIGLLALAFTGPRTPWGYLGVLPLLTGVLGRCPFYSMLGYSSCPLERKG